MLHPVALISAAFHRFPFASGNSVQQPCNMGSEVRCRLSNRVQLTTDGHRAYLEPLKVLSGQTLTTLNWSKCMALHRTARSDAWKSAKANLTQTYVAKFEGDRKVIGYISIMCAEVALEKTYEIADKLGADRYEYQPGVRIARLARCPNNKGKAIGRQLVETVIGVVLLSIVPNAGCRFLILDAKRKSVAFYKSMGFRLLDTPDNIKKETPLMFLDLRNLIDTPAAG